MELRWGGHRETFDIEVKKALRPATAGVTLHRLKDEPRTLLVADRITGRLAQLAREMGVSYADASGNAWISTPSFLIDIQGKGRADPVTSGEPPVTFTKADLRAIVAIIVRLQDGRGLTMTARELGEAAGVSHGAANLTIQKLRKLGFLSSKGLRRGEQLLDRWTEAYVARGGAHRASRTLYVDPGAPLRETLADAPGAEISGEFAGQLLGWPIRATSGVVYASRLSDVARHLKGSSEGPGMAVEVRTPGLAVDQAQPDLAASLVVRADMLMSGDPRQIEVAKEVVDRDENLRRLREIA